MRYVLISTNFKLYEKILISFHSNRSDQTADFYRSEYAKQTQSRLSIHTMFSTTVLKGVPHTRQSRTVYRSLSSISHLDSLALNINRSISTKTLTSNKLLQTRRSPIFTRRYTSHECCNRGYSIEHHFMDRKSRFIVDDRASIRTPAGTSE